MTDEEKMELLGVMTDEDSQTVKSAYLNFAKQIVFEKAYPFGNYPSVFPSRYDGVQVQIAAYLINKQGAEGEIVHLESTVSRHWSSGDVDPDLLRRITPFAVALGVNEDEVSETESTGD